MKNSSSVAFSEYMRVAFSPVAFPRFSPADANKAVRPVAELQKAAVGAFAAFTIASSVLTTTPPPAHAVVPFPTQVLAEKVIREGVYGEYEIDLPEQKYDDARSTFKSAKETKTKKGT